VEVLATIIRLQAPLVPGTDERPRPPDLEGRLAAARAMAEPRYDRGEGAGIAGLRMQLRLTGPDE